MLIALYLLYRIAFPKQISPKTDDENPQKTEPDLSEMIIKSRFVRPESGQNATNRTTLLQSDIQDEKPPIFAAGSDERSAIIPQEKMNEVFSQDEPNPYELEIEPDEDDETDETADLEEEAEELRQILGNNAENVSSGLSIEEITEAAAAVENPTDEKGAILFRVEKTDMFEQLVSGDTGKAERIKAIIERHVQSIYPTDENDSVDYGNENEWKNFDVESFLDDTGIYD